MSREGEWVIGIDLGTTNSCVGLWRNGRMEIIENDQGNKTTPSCVAFDDTEILVGEAAKNQAHMNPTNTIFAAKRLIGRRFSEESVRRDCKLWPFRVIPGPDDKPNIVVTYRKQEKRCPPEEISAVVLGKMRSSAEEFLGCKVTKSVITVPAYFNDSQRQATIDAAKIAGLHVLQIINEPTAAALAYSSGNWSVGVAKRTILIFDLGGGTLDVSLAEVRGGDGGVDVRATDGNTHLGGEDFDSRMVQHLIGLFRQKHGHDLMANPRAIRRLRTECESAKRNLSSTAQTDIFFPALYREIDFHVKMSRATFEEINRDLFAACLEPVKRCLAHARMEKSRVQDVVLVGGSTRIPMVRNLLKDYFQTDRLFMSISADEAVAHGAALLAAKLSSRPEQAIRRVDLGDVTPRSLGIDVRGGQMHVLINRNTSVPCRSSYLFTTPKDDMVSLRFKVCEGESKETRENNLLGEFYLHGLRKAPMGSVRIDVVFDIDKNGILTVSAKDLETQQVVQITIANTGRLEGETVEEMAREAESHRIEDRRRRKATAAKDELKRYLSWVENAVVEHRVWNLLDGASSRRSLESAMNNSRSWMESERSAEDFDFQDKMNDVRRVWEPIRRKLQELRVDVPEFRS